MFERRAFVASAYLDAIIFSGPFAGADPVIVHVLCDKHSNVYCLWHDQLLDTKDVLFDLGDGEFVHCDWCPQLDESSLTLDECIFFDAPL